MWRGETVEQHIYPQSPSTFERNTTGCAQQQTLNMRGKFALIGSFPQVLCLLPLCEAN